MMVEKQWWDEPRSLAECCCLAHTEVAEAVECLRDGQMELTTRASDGKPEGFGVELADIILRLADMSGFYPDHIMMDSSLTLEDCAEHMDLDPYRKLSELEVLQSVNRAIAAVSGKGFADFSVIEDIFRSCSMLAERHGIDLERLIELKMAFNATSPPKHGKRC